MIFNRTYNKNNTVYSKEKISLTLKKSDQSCKKSFSFYSSNRFAIGASCRIKSFINVLKHHLYDIYVWVMYTVIRKITLLCCMSICDHRRRVDCVGRYNYPTPQTSLYVFILKGFTLLWTFLFLYAEVSAISSLPFTIKSCKFSFTCEIDFCKDVLLFLEWVICSVYC